jgi:predicted transcriptional regulator
MRQITVRIDGEAESALDRLIDVTGQPQSQVVRDALITAQREQLRAQLREDALRCRNDPSDLAEAQAVATEMSSRRAW